MEVTGQMMVNLLNQLRLPVIDREIRKRFKQDVLNAEPHIQVQKSHI